MQNLGIGLLGGFIGLSHGLWMRKTTNEKSFGEALASRANNFVNEFKKEEKKDIEAVNTINIEEKQDSGSE